MKIHELKTWIEYWEEVAGGEKTFEVRKNDRNYKVGDMLFLRCYDKDKQQYTGKGGLKRVITYILKGGSFGISTRH
jgi:hypothetical protein